MTLHGDRVTCDVPGCCVSTKRGWDAWLASDFAIFPRWNEDLTALTTCYICPACRARYTDDQLRDMLALQPKETT